MSEYDLYAYPADASAHKHLIGFASWGQTISYHWLGERRRVYSGRIPELYGARVDCKVAEEVE